MPNWKKVIVSGSNAALEELHINKQGATGAESLLSVKSSNSMRFDVDEDGDCHIFGDDEKGSLSINQDRNNQNGESLLNLNLLLFLYQPLLNLFNCNIVICKYTYF